MMLVGLACEPLVVGPNEDISIDPFRAESDDSLQAEVALARTTLPDGTRGLVAAYMDVTGTFDGNSFRPLHSKMASAMRRDDGTEWTAQQKLAPILGTALQQLFADPWLTTNESGTVVWYSFLALVEGAGALRQPDGIAVAVSTNGGLGWDEAFPSLVGTDGTDVIHLDPVTVLHERIPVDKPSIAATPSGSSVYIAYVSPNFGEGNTVTVLRIDAGATEVSVRTVIEVPGTTQNPIIRVSPAQDQGVFVAFQERVGEGSRVRFARSFDRGETFPDVFTATAPDELVQPTAPRGARGAPMRNGIFMHYALKLPAPGEPLGLLHLVVYEHDGQVLYRVSPNNGTSWGDPVLLSQRGFRAFQPVVAASPDSVAFAFYEQQRQGGETSPRTAVIGRVDFGFLSSDPNVDVLTRDEAGEPRDFVVCPTTMTNFYGDYIGLVAIDTKDTFYAAWTDSRGGCRTRTPVNAIEAHVVGAQMHP